MRKNNWIIRLVLWFFPICLVAQTDYPNILLIIADDIGVDALGGYDVGAIKPNTPTIDSLRSEGITFTNVWSPPVCSPSRASILSGKYGVNTGVLTVPGVLSTTHTSLFSQISQRTSDAYATAIVGKWHLSRPNNLPYPTDYGMDYYSGVIGAGVENYYAWTKTEDQAAELIEEYASSYLTDKALTWIREQNKPWLMWLAHVAPHTPIHIPPNGMYTQVATNTRFKKYLAMIEALDFEVNRLIQGLSSAEKENTIIIFVGDNGTASDVLQDYPDGHGKGTLYQGGIHVPLIVSGAGVTRKGVEEPALINVLDIHATIIDIVDSTLSENGGVYNSLSFKYLLSNAAGSNREFNYTELASNGLDVNVDGYTIRDSIYKFIAYDDGAQEFFNLAVDPLETINLLEGTLTEDQKDTKLKLETEASAIRSGWSCNDGIKNGDETVIDCGGSSCLSCTSANSSNSFNSFFNFSIFPNPLSDHLNIRKSASLESENWWLEIFDVVGNKCLCKQLNFIDNQQIIDVSEFESQLLFIKIYDLDNGNIESYKIVKK